jgi:hypothetical protein
LECISGGQFWFFTFPPYDDALLHADKTDAGRFARPFGHLPNAVSLTLLALSFCCAATFFFLSQKNWKFCKANYLTSDPLDRPREPPTFIVDYSCPHRPNAKNGALKMGCDQTQVLISHLPAHLYDHAPIEFSYLHEVNHKAVCMPPTPAVVTKKEVPVETAKTRIRETPCHPQRKSAKYAHGDSASAPHLAVPESSQNFSSSADPFASGMELDGVGPLFQDYDGEISRNTSTVHDLPHFPSPLFPSQTPRPASYPTGAGDHSAQPRLTSSAMALLTSSTHPLNLLDLDTYSTSPGMMLPGLPGFLPGISTTADSEMTQAVRWLSRLFAAQQAKDQGMMVEATVPPPPHVKPPPPPPQPGPPSEIPSNRSLSSSSFSPIRPAQSPHANTTTPSKPQPRKPATPHPSPAKSEKEDQHKVPVPNLHTHAHPPARTHARTHTPNVPQSILLTVHLVLAASGDGPNAKKVLQERANHRTNFNTRCAGASYCEYLQPTTIAEPVAGSDLEAMGQIVVSIKNIFKMHPCTTCELFHRQNPELEDKIPCTPAIINGFIFAGCCNSCAALYNSPNRPLAPCCAFEFRPGMSWDAIKFHLHQAYQLDTPGIYSTTMNPITAKTGVNNTTEVGFTL